MKCLVTGSEGFIGKNLVARLKAEGHEVVGYDIKSGGESAAWIPNRVVNADVLFHLACINQMEATKDPFKNLYVNAELTRKLARCAAGRSMKFIYTSTASVYGNADVIPTPVDAAMNPLTDYAVAKLAGEYFVRNSGADWTILRLSNVYGPHQTLENPYCGVIGRFFEQARKGEDLTVIGDGMQTRDFTFVGDVVDNLMNLTDSRHKIHNVSHGREVPIGVLADYIRYLEGGKSSLARIEARAIDGVSRRCLVPTLNCPTPLGEGLMRTKEWFDAQ